MADAPTDVVDRTKVEKKEKAEKPAKQPKQKKDKQAGGNQKQGGKDKQAGGNVDTKGLTVTRENDLGLWYSEMITKAGIVSYYDIQDMYHRALIICCLTNFSLRCYILDPPLIFAWDELRKYFDAKIKTIGVRNCYYPVCRPSYSK